MRRYLKKVYILIVILSIFWLITYNYGRHEYNRYNALSKNHDNSLKTSKCQVINHMKYIDDDKNIYKTTIRYRLPNGTLTNKKIINKCSTLDSSSVCQHTLDNIKVNDMIPYYSFKNDIDSINILPRHNKYYLNAITWKYRVEVSKSLMCGTLSLVIGMMYVYNVKVNMLKMLINVSVIMFLMYNIVRIIKSNIEYNIQYDKWNYQQVDFTIDLITKVNISTDPVITQYNVFYKPNYNYQRHHGNNPVMNTINCPSISDEYSEDKYKKCVLHHDRYYKPGNIVHSYISKDNPMDIKLTETIGNYNYIKDPMIIISIVLWGISMFLMAITMTCIIHNKYKRE